MTTYIDINCDMGGICIHGDSPGADQIVAAVRDGLIKAGVVVKPLRDRLPR
jgi:lactam utilization protein B